MSDNEEIQRTIRRIFQDQFRAPMEPNEEIWDQCADSLDLMEIAAEIEEEFDIEVRQEEWLELTSVRKATQYTSRKIREGAENKPGVYTAAPAILPIPCTNVPQKTVKDWMQKLNEELDEVKQELFMAYGDIDTELEGTQAIDYEKLTEECCDLITTITSMLAAMGVDADKRHNTQIYVNNKNRERGYW